jgi:hypothetical protein
MIGVARTQRGPGGCIILFFRTVLLEVPSINERLRHPILF